MKASFSIPDSEEEAVNLQLALREIVDIRSEIDFGKLKHICGLDVAYHKGSDRLIAGAAVLSFPDLELVETKIHIDSAKFPYIPGLFSFRELPPLLEAIKLLETEIDLFVCDGQGIAHPRGFGLASHLGVVLDKPSIGCGKSNLCGVYTPPNTQKGDYSDIIFNEKITGRALRTQDNINPIFISVGHKCTLKDATIIVDRLTPKYRLPETTRQADQLVKRSMAELELQ
jgi:deoxyribonuclease V